VLVVTKADLGDVAMRAQRDLNAALRALGARETPVLAVSSIPPSTGIPELVAAIDEHRRHLELPVARRRARRLTALADFLAEHGEHGLRLLGGRRVAEGFLAELDPTLDAASLRVALEKRAGLTD
jgi:LAO/AO transport system kinase